MDCPRCNSSNILERKATTKRGFKQYQCRECAKYFNEQTGTAYNFTHYPIDIIVMTVFFYYRYKLSLVHVTEMMAMRGLLLSHETVRDWAQRFGTELGLTFRAKRWNQVGRKWHMDITYLKVRGQDAYLYRAIDKEGNLVDVYLSETRNKSAALKFFKQCQQATGVVPTQITTDKEPGFSDAIHKAFGPTVKHHDCKYLNNRIEQNHRGIKSWYRPMKGFKSMWSAMIACHVFEEIRQFFRSKKPLLQHRGFIATKFQEMLAIAY